MGEALIKTLLTHTELPNESLEQEINSLIVRAGFNKETLTIDQLREIMADYLQDILLEVKSTSEGQV